MQPLITISIDPDGVVRVAGTQVGSGSDDFARVVAAIPANDFSEIRVSDERDPAQARGWSFRAPHQSESVQDLMNSYPAEVYSAEDPDIRQAMRSSEWVYIDPEVLDRYGIQEQVQKIDFRPKKRETPVEPERTDEPEVVFDVEPERMDVTPDPEAEEVPVAEEPEVKKTWVRPEGAEEIDWTPEHEDRLLSAGMDADEIFRPHADTITVTALPAGVSETQVYLPGERLQINSMAERRARFKVKRERSRLPLYIGAALLLLAALVGIVKSGTFQPKDVYTAVCIDSRTEAITDSSACRESRPYTQKAYVPGRSVALSTYDSLPEQTQMTKPEGATVEIIDNI